MRRRRSTSSPSTEEIPVEGDSVREGAGRRREPSEERDVFCVL